EQMEQHSTLTPEYKFEIVQRFSRSAEQREIADVGISTPSFCIYSKLILSETVFQKKQQFRPS
ncbi:hypothetical protein, partial [Allocoleopsis sp.]|uniref:hypothetical protein n=1 Tax=Allocoleopsis sp. TaxID=3088169 RepID=UPI002FCF9642